MHYHERLICDFVSYPTEVHNISCYSLFPQYPLINTNKLKTKHMVSNYICWKLDGESTKISAIQLALGLEEGCKICGNPLLFGDSIQLRRRNPVITKKPTRD